MLGGLNGHTATVRELVPAQSSEPASFQQGKRLSINEIYRRSAPGVVQITSTSVTAVQPDPFFGNPFGLPQQQEQQALGSGFVIDKAGHVITNYHVVRNAKKVEVSFSNSESVQASIVGVDPSTDVAVLQVKVPSRALTPLNLGNSDRAQVGDAVVAIGNPLGLNRSVSAGIVSALQRSISSPTTSGYSIDHVIQTDAAVNHGNSGGPLLNAQGEVIGVNAQIETSNGGDGNIGIAFAIPINTVKTVVAQLIKNGRVEHPALGIRAQGITPQVAKLFNLPVQHGLLVAHVETGSGAARAGLEAGTTQVTVAGETYLLGGDIITKADGVSIYSLGRLRDLISAKQPGDSMELELYRGRKKLTLTVKLGRQSSSPR